MAPHRTTLRLECDSSTARKQPEWVYNGGDRVHPEVERGRTLERRRLRRGRKRADDLGRGGAFFCSTPANSAIEVSEMAVSRIPSRVLVAVIAVGCLHGDTKKLS